MTEQLIQQSSYTYDELIACSEGKLFGKGNAQLPHPPMLMFDRITEITQEGGQYGQGKVIAELDIKPELWFFDCHFINDPVMPGCLGLDALWQLTGFYLSWLKLSGKGRALGCSEVKFTGQVEPKNTLLRYEIDVSRIIKRNTHLIVADGKMFCDGQLYYTAKNLKVGLFQNI